MEQTAYFSAEIGFSPQIPTYSGGLGILAGDHLKAASDMGLPVVGVSLLYREGYFRQHLDADGRQSASYPRFIPEPLLTRLTEVVSIQLGNRKVVVNLWRYDLTGEGGAKVPMIFLDTDTGQNDPADRAITLRLYGGDSLMRLRQEATLALGGIQAVQRLFPEVSRYHLNEGHCALVPLVLLDQGMSGDDIRSRCHFTTHTPVPAGHDVFDYPMARAQIGHLLPENITDLAGNDALSMSELALNTCATANGVSALHGQVAREMFPGRDISHITNGVHHLTWAGPQMAALFDVHIEGWRQNPGLLAEGAKNLPSDELRAAHRARKSELLHYVNSETNRGYSPDVLTIGFARRAARYKRADLLFRDIDRLRRICNRRVQFVFAGKAHPHDKPAQELIAKVVAAGRHLGNDIRIAYLANYNMWTGALLSSGVDVWLNTPQRPREASGTSGMKAALNGVPNASIADGWWAEAADDNTNGWVIGDAGNPTDEADVESLYQTLQKRILPAYEDKSEVWVDLMRASIATSAQYTAARMVGDYAQRYYR